MIAALAVAAGLAVAAFAGARLIPKGSFGLLDGEVLGNLSDSLGAEQILGVWPSGDPREPPELAALAYAAMAIVAVGWALAVRRLAGLRDLPLAAWGVGTPLLGLAIWAGGSPWLGAKALTIATPAVLALGLAGLAALAERKGRRDRWRWPGSPSAAAGVLASTALSYSHLNLAPRDRFDELARVGELLGDRGPVLITEYEPYATRHFLREADPESPAELRRRRIPLRDGTLASAGRPRRHRQHQARRSARLPGDRAPRLAPARAGRRAPTSSPGAAATTRSGSGRSSPAASARCRPSTPAHLPLQGRQRPYGFADCDRLAGLFGAAGGRPCSRRRRASW